VDTETKSDGRAVPWNKGKLLGQKPPLKLREIWAIRIRLQLTHRRPLAAPPLWDAAGVKHDPTPGAALPPTPA
jgi:hypothetical protein